MSSLFSPQFDCICLTERWTQHLTTANASHVGEIGKRIEGRNNTRLRPFTRTAALGWEARWQQEVLQWILIVLKFKKDESNSQSFSWICALPFTHTFSRHDVCLQWKLSEWAKSRPGKTFKLTAVASRTHSERVSCCYTTVEIPFTVF